MSKSKSNHRVKVIEGRPDMKQKNILSSLIEIFEFLFKVKIEFSVISHLKKQKTSQFNFLIQFSACHRLTVETANIVG